MVLLRFLAFISLVVSSYTFGDSEFRKFSDATGREMIAKLTQVSGNDVYIERKDGLTSKVALSIFSKADQEYIQSWARHSLLANGAIEVRFATKTSDKTRFSDSRTIGLLEKTWNEFYGIVLNNTSYEDLPNIRVDYLVLKFEDALAAQKRSEGRTIEIRGSGHIDYLAARSEGRVQTKKIPMRETKLAPNYYWEEGGKEESEDDIRGIWAKIYVDGEFIMDFARPENLPRKVTW